MKVGDLVVYRGWNTINMPIGIVIDQKWSDSSFHHRIRVMWLGHELPIQAKVLSTSNKRITTWIHPKSFEVINETK